MQKLITGLVLFFICAVAHAQRMTPEEYIAKYKDAAIQEMKRSKVPASITLAQGLLETENGNSDLVQRSNNHFGIKCKSNWTGETVSHTDDAPNECFRKYPSARESYADHSDFLRANGRYASLFSLDPTDYKGWARGLKNAGYATNPRYPDILIGNIERYELFTYDLQEVGVPNAPRVQLEDSSRMVIKVPESPAKEKPATSAPQNNSGNNFNGHKAVFAPANTSLLAIATKAGISLSKLLEYNDLKKDGLLDESQYIYLERKDKEGTADTYTTTGNESLHDVAQAKGVQIKYLMTYNGFSGDLILKPGTVVKLKP